MRALITWLPTVLPFAALIVLLVRPRQRGGDINSAGLVKALKARKEKP